VLHSPKQVTLPPHIMSHNYARMSNHTISNQYHDKEHNRTFSCNKEDPTFKNRKKKKMYILEVRNHQHRTECLESNKNIVK